MSWAVRREPNCPVCTEGPGGRWTERWTRRASSSQQSGKEGAKWPAARKEDHTSKWIIDPSWRSSIHERRLLVFGNDAASRNRNSLEPSRNDWNQAVFFFSWSRQISDTAPKEDDIKRKWQTWNDSIMIRFMIRCVWNRIAYHSTGLSWLIWVIVIHGDLINIYSHFSTTELIDLACVVYKSVSYFDFLTVLEQWIQAHLGASFACLMFMLSFSAL